MIKRIKIRDFKSIRELDVELSPVTVLVGRSGTGKSNFVQAIRFLRNFLLNPTDAISYEGGSHRIQPAAENDPKTSICVSFSIPGEDADYEYELMFAKRTSQGQPFRLSLERLSLGSSTLYSWKFDGNRVAWEYEPKMASPPRPSGSPLLGQFPALQKVVYAFAALTNGIGYYHLPSSVLDFRGNESQRPSFWNTMPGLWDNAANFRDVMRSIVQDFHHPTVRKSLLATLQEVNSSIASIELDSLSNPQHAIVGHNVNDRILDLALEQESDGLRRFYAHLLALYQVPPKLTLIFEEPENAIFPGALALLADEFKAAPKENRGQVILTTHSPGLLDAFDADSIRAVDMKDGKTIIGPLAKEQREAIQDHLMTTGELLTADTPRIEETVEQKT